jgi:hypothetical protein
MEKYFKFDKKHLSFCASIILIFILWSCNEQSVIEGVATQNATKVSVINMNVDIPPNTKKPITLDFGGLRTNLEIYFIKTDINTTSYKYEFFCNPPDQNFRWAMETYIKKQKEGTLVNNTSFDYGGSPYFINALVTGGTFNYNYQNSFKINETSFAAFRVVNPSTKAQVIAWLKFTASATKVTLIECAYTSGSEILIGVK